MPQRGNFDYDQIRPAARQGNGLQLQMFGQAAVLNGTISSAATSVIVASNPSTMPSTPFTAEFDDTGEQIQVTAVVGTTWTVTRGYNSTTAEAHNNLTVLHCVPASYSPTLYDASGNVISGGGVNAKTASYTLVAADAWKVVSFNGSSLTATLPAAPPSSAWATTIQNLNASALTVSPNGLNLNGASPSITLQQFDVIEVWTDGTNYFSTTPLVAGTNITLTPASNGKTIAASGGGGGSVAISGPYFTSGGNSYAGFPPRQCVPPASTTFSWAHQPTGATVTADGNAVIMYCPPGNGSSNNWAMRGSSIGSTPYVDTLYIFTAMDIAYSLCGVGFYESATTKLIAAYFEYQTGGGSNVYVSSASSPTASATVEVSASNVALLNPNQAMIRLHYDGTNIYFYVSNDGLSWILLYSEAKTAHFTTAPDTFFWGCNSIASSATQGMTYMELLNWNQHT